MRTSAIFRNFFTYAVILLITYCISCSSKVVTHGTTARAVLPVLYIEKDSFQYWHTQHNTQIMFRFTYFDGSIALTGWAPTPTDDDNTYDTTHILPLKVSTEKQVKLIDHRIYLGNLRLSKNEVISLDSQLTANASAHYLIFIPMLDETFVQQVSYKILLSSGTNLSDSLYTIDPKADPSPPANRR